MTAGDALQLLTESMRDDDGMGFRSDMGKSPGQVCFTVPALIRVLRWAAANSCEATTLADRLVTPPQEPRE